MRNVLVLGGAGFIGSHIVRRFLEHGDTVAVIDGLLPRTGANRAHVPADRVGFVAARVEDVADLPERLAAADVIVDCMGWTCHRLALADPEYDLQLNAGSHLSWLARYRGRAGQRLIYLGSRGQYGRAVGEVTENTPMQPADIQGIHKLAAEHHFRFYSECERVPAISLRFANCTGRNQPVSGPDIGLVGGFVRDALLDRTIEVYGTGRRRPVAAADDVARLAVRCAEIPAEGFTAFNVPAHEIALETLAGEIVRRAGSGRVRQCEMPEEVRQIDVGDAAFSAAKLQGAMDFTMTPVDAMLEETLAYFRERRNDLAL